MTQEQAEKIMEILTVMCKTMYGQLREGFEALREACHE